MKYRLTCPDCGEKFRWEGERLPDFCPYCKAYVGVDPNFVPSQLNIGTAISKSADATYRAMEKASEARAEMSGDPNQKITNMRDNLREGDVAAMAPQPSKHYQEAVSAAAQGQDWSHWQGGMGATPEALALAKAGASQGTGAVAMEAITGVKGGGAMPSLTPRSSIGGLQAGFGGGR